jgi:hypothetical protein
LVTGGPQKKTKTQKYLFERKFCKKTRKLIASHFGPLLKQTILWTAVGAVTRKLAQVSHKAFKLDIY